MRILILATDIYTRGGIARYTYTLASALGDLLGPENVHVLALLAYGDPSGLEPRFRLYGPVTDRLTAAAKVQFELKALALARHKYDLIVCSHLGLALVAATIALVHRTPFWVVCHGIEVWEPLPLIKRVALRQSNRLLPVSRFTAQKLSEVHRIPRHKVSVVHNAISDDFERLLRAPGAAGGPEASPRPRERLLLSVGSLAKNLAYKGFDTVIRALPRVLDRVPNLRYVIVGDGDDRPRLEQLTAKHHLQGHVTFAGSVSDEQLAQCYRSCDVFVLPSRTITTNGSCEGEGFGRVYIEASLAGKPVVGSRGGGAAEAVLRGETGMLVDPTSVEETAGAIIKLLQNPAAARQMGQKGREWALENFTENALRRSLGSLLHASGFGESRGKFSDLPV
jgi:glycosyltransferase involved in cell wall biosynthesis